MTMTPCDPSVDVRRRLTELHTWQSEWQRLDRALEERLLGLDGTKLVELQQAAHLTNLRRRMGMTLAKTPLTVPESVLSHLGVRSS